MAVGAGLMATAVFSAAVVLVVLVLLGWVEDRFSLKSHLTTFRLTTARLEEAMARATMVLTEMKVTMQHFQVFRVGAEFVMEFDADVSHIQQDRIVTKLSELEGRCEVVPLDTQRE